MKTRWFFTENMMLLVRKFHRGNYGFVKWVITYNHIFFISTTTAFIQSRVILLYITEKAVNYCLFLQSSETSC